MYSPRDTASALPSARPQEAVQAGSAGRHQLRAAIEARGSQHWSAKWAVVRFFVLLCAQLLEEVFGLIFSYAAASTLWRRRSNPARPYMDRLMTFNRLICPSTGPVLQGSVKAACTASRS